MMFVSDLIVLLLFMFALGLKTGQMVDRYYHKKERQND